MSDPIRTLVVDDEPLNAKAHAAYLARLSGFTVAGLAGSGVETLRMVHAAGLGDGEPLDLILLDMHLPDINGVEVCRRIRASGRPVDVIAITAVREVALVREAISLGVLAYLMKPFTFATFAEKLTRYAQFRDGLADETSAATQTEVDEALATLRGSSGSSVDKGLTPMTLTRVVHAVGQETSARELGTELGLSRVTARRYLEHLVQQGLLERTARYGTPGRPEIQYRRRRPRSAPTDSRRASDSLPD